MIPNSALTTQPVPTSFLVGNAETYSDTIDFEEGGIALGNATEGLQYQVWKIEIIGDDFVISAPNAAASVLFTAPGSTEVSLSFDQNMRPAVAFVQTGIAKLRFFNTAVSSQVIMDFPDAVNPRCTLDDKRPSQVAASDIILAYLKNNNLYFRQQRDRFQTEYLLKTGVTGKLLKVGMNTGNRLQFEIL